MTDRATTRLRNAINAEKLLIMPGGFSPLAARLCESLGYESFFLAGSQTNAHIYGQPDIGLIGLQDRDQPLEPRPSATPAVEASHRTALPGSSNPPRRR